MFAQINFRVKMTTIVMNQCDADGISVLPNAIQTLIY